YTPYQILTYYYGDDLDIVRDAPVRGIEETVPPYPLRLGSTGDDVRTIQIRLNRISRNYPAIPKIADTNGFFSYDTQDAVRKFQEIFNLTPDGIIGRATWYRIQYIYNGIKRLNAINAEGISPEEVTGQYPEVLREGDSGIGVRELQYYLQFLGEFNREITPVDIDGIFGPATAAAVRSVQQIYELPVDGIVGVETWRTILNAYYGTLDTLDPDLLNASAKPYAGVPLVIGSQSEEVRILQEYLNVIAQTFPEIPTVNVTGLFGTQTQAAVSAFQRLEGLPVTGRVTATTWTAIADLYLDLREGGRLGSGQYPGFPVGQEEE
ncbi:MAG: peptidoglycan-binding protein, partial [Clostridia bacterium]|nr:peptidoglycan-binding protein [Clostridia bacterium]